MTQLQHYQTVAQEEEIEDLLTKESYDKWFDSLSRNQWNLLVVKYPKKNPVYAYLKEHGLPLDSKIKGL